jgi:protein MPE1
VYDDDTTIIPRSTTVIARRMPPKVSGRGGAARYVSGKMPVHAKNSSRREQIAKPVVKAKSNTLAQLSSAMTEEEKMAAVFQAQTENFTSREEEMATYVPAPRFIILNQMLTDTRQQYVAKGGPKKPANVPDHDPPQGYICYRCGEKGHWIQLCPTNENPEYDNRPRVKRTTGIPRSFLKTVDKATALGQHADGDDSKTPSGIMVNADGEFVIAEPDKASWEQFQAKTKANPAAQKAAAEEGKEVRERGLECPADKKMFIEPMKTPCCEKTYCNDCITNALIESDFVCPACKTEGVLIDDLKTDEEAVEKIKAFLAEKDGKKEGSKSPVAAESPAAAVGDGVDSKADADKAKSKSPSPAPSAPATTQPGQTSTSTPQSVSSTPATGDQQTQVSKKRPADDALENPKIPKAPKAMQKAQEVQQNNMMPMMNGMPAMGGMPGMPGMPAMGGMPMMFPGMPMMGGNFGPMGGMPNMNMGMMNPMMNPMMAGPMGGGYGGMNTMAGPGGFNGGWGGPGGDNMGMNNNMNAGPGAGGRMNGGMGMGGGYGGGGAHHHQQQQQQHHQQHQQHQQGQGQGHQQHFQQQQQQQHHNNKNFSYQPADEEDAYFRKPVNPHRHQNRQRRVRPSDYREL